MNASELYQSVTAQIVAALTRGDLPPWRQSWSGGIPSLPLRHNGIPYRGANTIILLMAVAAKGYSSPYYLTFKQALEYGGSVRKGEKSTAILWCEPRTKTETADDGTEAESRFWISKVYRVFNAEQCDNLPERFTVTPTAMLDPAQRIEHADTFINNCNADIRHHGQSAYYRPSEDYINLPRFETFASPEDFYATALHELCHWSGAEHRLNRDLSGFGNREKYSREEIIAELGSVMVSAQLGIAPQSLDSHAAYLQHWIAALKEDHRYLFTAASKAQAAADYLNGLQPQPEA